jgi:hypothetical protein
LTHQAGRGDLSGFFFLGGGADMVGYFVMLGILGAIWIALS